MIRELLGVKLREARGALRSQHGRVRIPTFAVLSLIFAGLLYGAGEFVTTRAMEIDLVGELLVHKLLSITVLVFFALLLFSNVVSAFSTFYLAEDLKFLMSKPIPTDELFASRFVEVMVQSSWILALFGLPLFLAVGVQLNADWYFYPLLILVLIPFVAIPTALATIFALLVTNIIAANRTRDAALFFGLVAFTALFVMIRSFEPERLLNPDSFDSIGELMQLLTVPSLSYLPNDWVVNILTPLLFELDAPVFWSAMLLFTTPVALFFIAAWLHRPLYFRGYSNAQEGQHQGGLMVQVRNWMMEKTRRTGVKLSTRIENLRNRGGRGSDLRQMVRKDQAVFTRDASQWSQLLIVLAIIVIYLVNFKYFEVAADEALIGDAGLVFFNLAACAFVVVALCGRFLFPAVSVEGKSFWLVLQAPITLERFLLGKWLGSLLPVVLVGQFLIWSSNLLVGIDLVMSIISSVQVLIISLVASAMAVAMGAMYPQFHKPNAAKIASSFGAVIYMIVTIVGTLVLIALWFRVSVHLGDMASRPAGMYAWLAAVSGLVIAGGTIPVVFKLGAYFLDRQF